MNVRVVTMTPEHLDDVVPVHLDAFRGYMNTKLGPRYARAMLTWFMTAERGIALVALDADGTAVGYVAGAPAGYGPALTRDLLAVAMRSALMRPWLLVDRDIRERAVGRVRSLFRRASNSSGPEPDTIHLVAVGVASRARGRHVGASLVAAFEQQARRLGMRTARLSVYQDNVAARRLYERAGWTVLKVDGRALYLGRRLP